MRKLLEVGSTRSCPIPGRGDQGNSFPQEDFAPSSWFPAQETLGLGCSTTAVITGREMGGSLCLSLPAVTKLHQHPWAGPGSHSSSLVWQMSHHTTPPVRWAGEEKEGRERHFDDSEDRIGQRREHAHRAQVPTTQSRTQGHHQEPALLLGRLQPVLG